MTDTSSLITALLGLAAGLETHPYFAIREGSGSDSGSGSPDKPYAEKLRARRKANKVASASRKRNRRK